MTENSVEIKELCKTFYRLNQESITICENLNLELKNAYQYKISENLY